MSAVLLFAARIWLRLALLTVRAFAGAASIKPGGDYAAANRRLRRTLDHAVEPVPCPRCDWYQPDMVREARARSFGWTSWLELGCIALSPVLWFEMWTRLWLRGIPMMDDFDAGSAFTVAVVTAFVTVASLGAISAVRWLATLTVDPNSVSAGSPPMFPDHPVPITEEAWTAKMAAQTRRLTAVRQQSSPANAAGPRRIVPPVATRKN